MTSLSDVTDDVTTLVGASLSYTRDTLWHSCVRHSVIRLNKALCSLVNGYNVIGHLAV